MKNIILKVPSFVFLLLIFLPLILWYFGVPLEESPDLLLFIRLMPSLIAALWTISLIEYMRGESTSTRYIPVAYFFLGLNYGAQILALYFILMIGDWGIIGLLEITALISTVAMAVFVTFIVRQVFYARTTWFVFLEVLVFPVGMFTLTPDVRRWEKSDKV